MPAFGRGKQVTAGDLVGAARFLCMVRVMSSWKRTFYAMFVAQTCSIIGFSVALPFIPFYIRELGVTGDANVRLWSGIVNASAGVTMAISAPIWGMVADRFGRRLMVLRAMYGGAIVLTAMAFTQDVYQLTACRLLQGALTGTITASTALVASVTPRHRAGYALGMIQAAVYVGFSVGPFFGGVVADAFADPVLGYRATFVVAGLFLLGGALLVQFATEERFAPADPDDTEARGSFRQVFVAAGFLAAVFVLLILRFANSVVTPIFALFVEDIVGPRGNINKLVGTILGVGGVAAALGAFVFGRVSDAWGHKRLLVVLSIVCGILASLYYLAASIAHLFVIRILFGFTSAGMMPAANAIIRRTTHDRNMGRAYGVTASLGAIGWVLGPLAGGTLAAALGLRAPFILMGAVLVLTAAVVAWRVDAEQNVPVCPPPESRDQLEE